MQWGKCYGMIKDEASAADSFSRDMPDEDQVGDGGREIFLNVYRM